MTLKLNEEVTREQLKDLGFMRTIDIGSDEEVFVYYSKHPTLNEYERLEVWFKDKLICIEVEVDVEETITYCEIPTIIKTMIERGMC